MQQLEDSRVRGVLKSIGVAEGKIKVKAKTEEETEELEELEPLIGVDSSWTRRIAEARMEVREILDTYGLFGLERLKYQALAYRLQYFAAVLKAREGRDQVESKLNELTRFMVENFHLNKDMARLILQVVCEKLLND